MLECKGLCAAYGERQVLFDLSFSLESGCFLGIIGPNGSGKSTLLKCLSLLHRPSAGEVLLDGESLKDRGRRDVARKLSYLSQGRQTPDMTVEQTVLHGRFCHHRYPCIYTSEDRRLARLAMEKTSVADLAKRSMLTLSGGQRQRVYLAALRCQDSPYVLLDEPGTYLDVASQFSLMKELCAMARDGRGVAAVMHDLPLALRFCQRILLLCQGRAYKLCTPEELCKGALLREVFGVDVVKTAEGSYAYRYE